ncbi:MAG: Flp family type IVb pilin [Dehalococcoidia bacterium]|nr:MAG: Flp family type IVb pilin [Dehalococcoidia bacterium]
MNHIKSIFGASEEGQGTIEYILVLGVIVVGIFGLVAMTNLGTAISGALNAVTGLFTSTPIG